MVSARGTSGLVQCALCPECKAIVSPDAEPYPTLIVVDDPLDSHDLVHWQCLCCGYGDVPAEWVFFAGSPTADFVKSKDGGENQAELFDD